MPMINMDDYPHPCSRRNPHTRHGYCPGTAPEFPGEDVEVVPTTADDLHPDCRFGGTEGSPCLDVTSPGTWTVTYVSGAPDPSRPRGHVF